MRQHRWMMALVLFLFFILPFCAPRAEAGTGSIRAKIVLPGDPGTTGSLSVGIQPMAIRPMDGGDGGGGDGGGSDSGGGDNGGDGGYPYDPWNPLPPVIIGPDRIIALEDLTAGLYNLILQYGKNSNDEYQLALKNIRVLEGQVTDLKDLMMKKGGAITGEIRLPGSIPLGDVNYPTATVHVVGFAGTNASTLPPWLNSRTIAATDLSGNFTLTNLPEGTYALAITPGGDAAATHAREVITNIRVEADKTTSATPFGPFELTSTMGALSGRVRLLDRPTGPYGGTFVRATSTDGRFRSYIQVTDNNGYYDFGKIPIGTYHLYIQHPNYTVSEGDITLTSAGTTPPVTWLDPGTKKICGNILLLGGTAQKGDISGDKKIGIVDTILALQTAAGVKTSPTLGGDVNSDDKVGLAEAIYSLQIASELRSLPGSNLSGTLVMIPGTALMASTDGAGNFTIEGIPERTANNWTYDLFISREGYQTIRRESVAAQDACNFSSLSFILAPHETVAVGGKILAKGSIMGRAWLKKNTDDYRGIDVAIENTGFVAKPNALGNFIFTDVAPGTYTLNYTNAGYKTVAEAGVLVAPNRSTETRNVVLIPRTGTIKGKVTLEGTANCAGVQIRVEPGDAQIASFPTDANCNFSIPVPENYNVLMNQKCVLNAATGGCAGSASYTVVAGDQALEELGYRPHSSASVNVPAGETVDLGTVELKKAPVAPTGVTVTQASGSSVKVEWTASTSTDVAGYHVYYGTRSDVINQKANIALIITQSADKWQFTVTGLAKGIKYYFIVTATDTASLESKASESAWAEIIPKDTYPSSDITYDGAFSWPQDIAIGRDDLRAYVTNTGSNTVSVIDLARKDVIAYYNAGTSPWGIVANPQRDEIYVLARPSAYVIDIKETIEPGLLSTLDASASMPGLTIPQRGVVSTDGRYLFVSDHGDRLANNDRVFIFDLDTHTKVMGLESGISVGIDPMGMAIAGKELYVANSGSNTISVIDIDLASPTKWQIKGNISGMYYPLDVAARPDGRYVYVANADAHYGTDPDEIAVIDTTTHTE